MSAEMSVSPCSPVSETQLLSERNCEKEKRERSWSQEVVQRCEERVKTTTTVG